VRQRFGEAMMPNEGEYQRPLETGGFSIVFPRSNAKWDFSAEMGEELSDEMLEVVSGGAGATGPGPAPNDKL
jgi:hypothetical protein